MKFSFSDETLGELLLILSSILFSLSFIGSRYAMVSTQSDIGPWTFNAFRYSVSFIVLLVLEPLLRKHPIFKFPDDPQLEIDDDLDHGISMNSSDGTHLMPAIKAKRERGRSRSDSIFQSEAWNWWSVTRISKKMLQIIVIQGSSNFVASILLQIGLQTLDASKAAFITSCYVVVIPFVECFLPLLSGGKLQCLSTKIWIEVIICIMGVYLISGCTAENTSCFGSVQDSGEIYVVSSVLFWVVNIMICDEAGKFHDSILLTLGDFAVVSLLTIMCSIIFERHLWVYPYSSIIASWPVILFVGFFEAFAYLLSTVGQIYVKPSRAAIIYSGETLFTCLGGYLFLGELLTPMELLGGGMICLSSVLTSLSFLSDELEEETIEKVEGPALEILPLSAPIAIIPQATRKPLTGFDDKDRSQSHSLESQSHSQTQSHSPWQPPQLHTSPHTTSSAAAALHDQQQYQYLPPYMQLRRQRGGSVSRYPIFRNKPVTHFECSKPIAIHSPHVEEGGSHEGSHLIPHYGSLPAQSTWRTMHPQQPISSSL